MSIVPIINEIAKASVLTDEHDLPALVGIRDRLQSVSGQLESTDLGKITDCIEHASGLIERIVHRETENAAAELDQVRLGIEYLQRALQAEEEGRPLSEAGPNPYDQRSVQDSPRVPCPDKELLASWIEGSTAALAELETKVASLTSAQPTTEAIADIRRIVHTLKGECGVLSLHDAQKLLQQAEIAIDRVGVAIPADALTSLIGWLRDYVDLLFDSPTASAPPSTQLIARFQATTDTSTSTSPTAQTLPQVATTTVAAASTQFASQPDDQSPVGLTNDSDMAENLNDFMCEAREHIANSEQALLQLERDPTNIELINTVFRAFHTIKGVAGFMNLRPIVTLAHSAEFLLDGARNGKFTLDSRYLSIILKTCDLMSQMIKGLEGGPLPTNGQLRSMVHQLEQATCGELAPATASTSQDVRPAPAIMTEATATPLTEQKPVQESTTTTQSDTASPQSQTQAQSQASPQTTGQSQTQTAATKRADQTVKVSTSRMDMLVDMVGELVIAQQMVAQDPSIRGIGEQRVQRNLTMVGKIIRDLQEVSMALRMVPIKATFQKMARLVRDVSTKANKQISLHTEGEDVELDRNVVEEIADPLVHMVRNACDHGIEDAEGRRASGKSVEGNIWLRAFHSGGSIVVEIEDDGKGLNRSKIIAKAIEKGIYTPDRPVADIPDSEVFNLVFLAGFSTADKVTDISGRGVGMDVVRRNIEALRGKVEIRSVAGKGSVFSMRLPLTMAIIDGMVVRVGTDRYVIPTLSIERSFRPKPADLHSVVGKGELAMVRGMLVPIQRLSEVLGRGKINRKDPVELLIVVESAEKRACLAVDEIIGQQQVVIKTLGQQTQSIRGVSGGAILGDGRVAIILDVGGIISRSHAA